jgi:hypothetical protein
MRAFAKAGAVLAMAALPSLIVPAAVAAQQPTAPDSLDARAAAALATVQKLFDAMLSRDTAALRSTFDPAARLVGAVTRDGQTSIRTSTVDQFVSNIASAPPDAKLIEKIYAPEVRVDGNLATVWTFYTFHLGDRFSHCGIDAAQLFETENGWKIINLADTRRTTNCDPPGG